MTGYVRILLELMKTLFSLIFGSKAKKTRKTIEDYKNDLLVKQGREQFKKLLEKGINVPVALL